MGKDKEIHVAVKSIGRPDSSVTMDVMPFATIWVPDSQVDDYERSYPGRVRGILDASDGNICRKQNTILDESPSDLTLILDDDITGIFRFEDTHKSAMNPDEIWRMIEHGFDMAQQLGVTLWGINQNLDPMCYRTFGPLSFLAPILGPFHGHINTTIRWDESVQCKDDYDFWLQTIRRDHKTLRFNKYHYTHDHGKMAGGFATIRSMNMEAKGQKRMVEKWGSAVFRAGGSTGGAQAGKRTPNMLNSLVRVPIRGC